MTDFKKLDDLRVGAKRVLVRIDLNVPMQSGRITDGTRIERSVPTLEALSNAGAKVVVMSHLGRPKGQIIPAMTLASLIEPLSESLGGRPVRFAPDCIGARAETIVTGLVPGEVALLENLRFHPGEESNDPKFADSLAALGDLYVNDAFSVSHRAHASTTAVAERLPSAAGRLMEVELDALHGALSNPLRPLVVVVGGSKVSTKLNLLGNLVKKADSLIIGGGMANTFLYSQGYSVGKSLCEVDLAQAARDILAAARLCGCDILLPEDVVVSTEFKECAESETVSSSEVGEDAMILDIGASSVSRAKAILGAARTLVWNGPLGAFELEPFDKATVGTAREAARLTRTGRLSTVAGGGDTIAALRHAGVFESFSYVSTAGGAFLAWLEGKTLPGVAALEVKA